MAGGMFDYDFSDTPIVGHLGDPFNGKKPNHDNNAAQAGLDQAQHAFDNLGGAPLPASITPQNVGTGSTTPQSATSLASLDPQAQAAQKAQMAALSGLAANGGRNAASDANLANIQAQEGAQAQGLRGAAMQDAARRGMSNGNTGLLAQLQGNQAAISNASMQGANLAGNMANTAVQAGQGAAGIGAGLQGQQNDYSNAKDIMSRFNSGQDLASQQFNHDKDLQAQQFNAAQGLAAQQYNSQAPMQQYGAKLATAAGQQGGGKAAEDYWSNKYKEDQQANGAVLGGLFGLAGAGAQAFAGKPKTMAKGGMVPGPEVVKGDSLLNDIVPYKGPKGPINLSGGEVVVPKTLRHEDNDTIGNFVKHPPKTEAPIVGSDAYKKKGAMLGALKHLGRK